MCKHTCRKRYKLVCYGVILRARSRGDDLERRAGQPREPPHLRTLEGTKANFNQHPLEEVRFPQKQKELRKIRLERKVQYLS